MGPFSAGLLELELSRKGTGTRRERRGNWFERREGGVRRTQAIDRGWGAPGGLYIQARRRTEAQQKGHEDPRGWPLGEEAWVDTGESDV